MPFSLICKGCKSTLKAPDQLAGKKGTCPKRTTPIRAPTKQATDNDAEEEEDDFAPVEVMPDERIREAPPRKTKPARSRYEDEDEEEEEDDRRSNRIRAARD